MSSGIESDKSAVVFGPAIVLTIFLGLGVTILIFILKWIKQERSEKDLNDDTSDKVKIAESSASSRSSKKEQTGNQKSKKKLADRELRRATEKGFNHPWMLVTLKGHSGRVLDMDFSANEKYLVSSADEEPDPGEKLCFKRNKRKVLQRRPKKNSMLCSSSTSSSNSSLDLCSSPPSPTTRKGLSRRQRKNASKKNRGVKLIEENSTNSKTKMWAQRAFWQQHRHSFHVDFPGMDEHHMMRKMEADFVNILKTDYVMSEADLAKYGYPVSVKINKNKPSIFSFSRRAKLEVNTLFVCYPDSGNSENTDIKPRKKNHLDINAAEFVPSCESSSGHSSGTNTDDEIYFDETGRCLQRNTVMVGQSIYLQEQKDLICARCGSQFSIQGGNYITLDKCCYHPGKLRNHNNPFGPMEHSCCGMDQNSPGCEWGNLHVWNGPKEPIVDESFVVTKPSKFCGDPQYCGVYALDCEMSYTVAGLEVVKVAIVDILGTPIYVQYVEPANPVVDFNTRYSGIVAEDFVKNRTKSLKQVQRELMNFICNETVLIGHGLENDLKGLKIVHKKVVDTAFTFPHYYGLPFKRSLRNLVQTYLKKSIHCDTLGHNPCEDARSCMDLMLFRVSGDQMYNKSKKVDENTNSKTTSSDSV